MSDTRADRWINRIGGIAAIVVAIGFPFAATWWSGQTKDFATKADIASVANKKDVEDVATDLASYKRETSAILNGINNSLAGVNTTLAVINEKLLNDGRQDRRLEDLEGRVRAVERTK